jgi:uncharacterized protein YggU (UPF0235/DUF167 family)
MKKILLSNSQLEQVLNLREKGLSWIKIEKATGIARRIAKREYDEWSAKQSQRQLVDARKEVVAQEYRMHLDLISRMANFLLDSLVIPDPLTDLRRADEVMSQFLAKDFYQDQSSFELRLGDQQRLKRVIRMNELLFKSLHDHTKRWVPWQVLNIWKEARNSCVKDIMKMRKEISEVFTNILRQKSELKEKIDKVYSESSVIEDIIRGLLINIWLSGVIGINSQVITMKGASLITRGTAWVIFHEKAPSETNVIFDREAPSDNKLLAKEMTGVSRWAIENLLKVKSELVQNAKREVHVMQGTTSKLEEVLNPLVLRPMILNTKCDICPI